MKTLVICLSKGADPRLFPGRRSACPGLDRSRRACPTRACPTRACPGHNAGFTILELLVVLTLMAAMTGLVLPRMASLFDAGQRNFERGQVIDSLAALPYAAFQSQRAFTLKKLPGDGDDVPLELPEGWTLESVDAAGIQYRSNGFCSGGSLRLSREGVPELVQLDPPMCTPRVL